MTVWTNKKEMITMLRVKCCTSNALLRCEDDRAIAKQRSEADRYPTNGRTRGGAIWSQCATILGVEH